MKTVCIYHSIDLDGWMSAAIVKRWFKKNNKDFIKDTDSNFCDFIGYNYGDPIPDVSEYDKVTMVDISFPKEEMDKIGIKKLVWIDHHISAIKDSEPYPYNDAFGIRDTNFAACELTWQYFFPNEPMPEIVRLLGRYDCFGHKPQWKSVDGYECIYEVSSHGKVRSIDRTVIETNTNKSKQLQGKELSAAISKSGYLVVNLFKNNIGTLRNIHDLVAKAFIPNPENKPTINHKDSNRLNCYVTNLEWNTYEENNNHSITNGDRGYPVSQYDKNDNYITTFDSIIIAEKETGITSQNIGKVCKGKRNSAGGFIWKYDTKKSTPQFIPPDEEQKITEFQYGARAVITNYEEAYEYLLKDLKNNLAAKDIYQAGRIIYAYLCVEAQQTYKNEFTIYLDEIIYDDSNKPNCKQKQKFICINRERFNPSNFNIDYHKDGYDGVATFYYTGKHWSFSLYSDTVDCSVIAKQYGGGGHKGAAGFIVKNEDIVKFLNQ